MFARYSFPTIAKMFQECFPETTGLVHHAKFFFVPCYDWEFRELHIGDRASKLPVGKHADFVSEMLWFGAQSDVIADVDSEKSTPITGMNN